MFVGTSQFMFAASCSLRNHVIMRHKMLVQQHLCMKTHANVVTPFTIAC